MNKRIYAEMKSYVFMTAGLVIFTAAWVIFLIPQQIVGGGLIGLASLINYASGFSVSYSYFIINTLLVTVGSIILGKGFGIKTLYCIGVNTLLFALLPKLGIVTTIQDNLLNAIIGGGLSGVGIAMVFMQGGSTGGTDILALVITHFRNTSPGRVFLYCDLIIVGSAYFLPDGALEKVIYGYVEMGVFSYVIDLVLSGNKQSVQIMVFSRNYEAIAERITTETTRGVTVLKSMGWYTRQEGHVLIIVARKNEATGIYRIIKETDSKAFISVGTVMGVFGEGFEQIKTGKIAWKKTGKISGRK
jgi:uncharacterized membrane-anchored protein YitT (DUF2179 family)